MNDLLLQKVKNLTENEWNHLQKQMEYAPLLKKLAFTFRNHQEGNLKTRTLVHAVYGNAHSEDFAVLENRLYKLRKKLSDLLQSLSGNVATRKLAQEEETKELCKAMIEIGELAQAIKTLGFLEEQCYSNNIFELLPEIIDMLIQANQSLNRFSETQKLYPKFEETTLLYIALAKMKVLARQVYETNVNQGIHATQPLFKQMDLIARAHTQFPRFKLIYNFVAAYYKAGSGGKNGNVKSYAVSRHIAVAKELMKQNPNMPIIGYSKDFQQVQQFRIKELETMFLFRQFRFEEAATVCNELLKDVLEPTNKLKRLLNEVLLSNTIHVNIAAKNSEKAFEAVKIYFQFLRDNKHHERMPRAFCELANVASTLHIKPPFLNAKTLLKGIDDFIADAKKNKYSDLETSARFLKAKTLFLLGKKEAALKIFESKEVQNHFLHKPTKQLFYELLFAIIENKNLNKRDFSKRLKKIKFNLQTPENIMEFVWIERALEKYFQYV